MDFHFGGEVGDYIHENGFQGAEFIWKLGETGGGGGGLFESFFHVFEKCSLGI